VSQHLRQIRAARAALVGHVQAAPLRAIAFGVPISERVIRPELLDETGDAVASPAPALLARDDEIFELSDQVGGSDRAFAGH
jgi:hypothetical protein